MPQVSAVSSFPFLSFSVGKEKAICRTERVTNTFLRSQSLVFAEQAPPYVYQNVNFRATVKLVDDDQHPGKLTGYVYTVTFFKVQLNLRRKNNVLVFFYLGFP